MEEWCYNYLITVEGAVILMGCVLCVGVVLSYVITVTGAAVPAGVCPV